jgi:hypothetical protein
MVIRYKSPSTITLNTPADDFLVKNRGRVLTLDNLPLFGSGTRFSYGIYKTQNPQIIE